ncbi:MULTISPECIES: hypothetical protein [Saccharopolyspora]|uniref:Secreted protein n=1 Tax=Saccharopolyspora elongata TaxID=2530387 RepID=A0A4R4Z8J0_9PSEU|nr:hypothetical protein [Saccharopolyspora elongata]TDD52502.1 hypothetical protein E1288_11930 [Saccharopolyspora elongata]
MRLRATVAAALGAAGLLLSLPGSALAADGEFSYWVEGTNAYHQRALLDPAGRLCHRLELPNPEAPAYGVRNNTDATAIVFLDSNCSSDVYYYVLQPGQQAPRDVAVRSVTFSR